VQLFLHPKFETNPINFTLHSRMSIYDSHIIHSGKPVHSDITLERHYNSILTVLLGPYIESRLRYQYSTGNSTWHLQPFRWMFSSEENYVLCQKVRTMQFSLRRNGQETAKGPHSLINNRIRRHLS